MKYFLLAASLAAAVTSPFTYSFFVPGSLEESGSMNQTSSPYWWLNSGAYLTIVDSVGKTVQGELPIFNKWRVVYAASNPEDTDDGYHPQNIFRLVTRSQWQNFQQEVYFKINKDNLSKSPNRNASNGLLLFNRYTDGNNLYYAGVRVDGGVVIKKKKNGVYYTMAYKRIFPGAYNVTTNPNLLPKNTWLGLRTTLQTNADGSVTVKLFTDQGRTGIWTLALEARDDGKSFGGAPLTAAGYGGMRTDFMDVEFDNYAISNL